MYTLNRAYIMTYSAAGTLFVIYGGEVVFYLYGSTGAGLFALAAGDTAVKADLAHLGTLVVA